MKLSNDQIENLIYDLQGTCLSLDEALHRAFEVDLYDVENEIELCDKLDERIFLCRECGWWYEAGEWNPDGFEPGNGEICVYCMPVED